MAFFFNRLFSEKSLSPLRVWVILAAYALLICVFVQFLALPHLFPSLHHGNGQLVGPGDWIGFHERAAENAQCIKKSGWSCLDTAPFGGWPVVITTVLYAAFAPKPWVLIPLQVLIFSLAGLFFFLILKNFVHFNRSAFIGTLPFYFFPTSLIWLTQIHRDGYAILGFLSLLYGWIVLLRKENWSEGERGYLNRGIYLGLPWVYLGLIPLLASRPYLGEIFLLSVLLTVLLILIELIIRRLFRAKVEWAKQIQFIVVVGIALLGLVPAQRWGISKFSPPPEPEIQPSSPQSGHRPKFEEQGASTSGLDTVVTSIPPSGYDPTQLRIFDDEHDDYLWYPYFGEYGLSRIWVKSSWIPEWFENKFFSMSHLRDGFRRSDTHAATALDLNVRLASVHEFMLYFPRALQIGFLSPFPVDWSGEGSIGAAKLFRRITGVETLVVYTGIILFVLFGWQFLWKREFWLVVIAAFAVIICNSYVITNVGTLYRLRYAPLLLLVGIGIAAAANRILGVRHVKQRNSFGTT